MRVTLKRFNFQGSGLNYVVVADGAEIGSIFKFKDTKTEKHPWKAYFGIGMEYKYVGAFYKGRQAAIDAVVEASQRKAWTQIVQLTLDNMSEYHDLNELDTWEMAHKIIVALTAAMDTDISNK